MDLSLMIIAALIGMAVSLLIVMLAVAWWYTYGKRVVICRRKGHEYSRRDLDDFRRLVVRERKVRDSDPNRQHFVASVVWKTPPAPGQHVVLYRYGNTAEEAERRALEAFYV